MPQAAPRLKLVGVAKRFPGVQALKDVDFAVAPGEIVALIGENGAGKSTLAKIVTGVYPPDAGDVFLDGQPIAIDSVRRARSLGIAIVYQELVLVPQLSVAENILLGREPHRLGFVGVVSRRQVTQLAMPSLELVGGDISPDAKVSDLSMGDRQRVEIAKALSLDAHLLILDEPTSSLTVEDVERLFAVMQDLRRRGIAVIFISHRLDEVLRISDRVVCLRDGEKVGDVATSSVDRQDLVRMMVGREVASYFAERSHAAGEVALAVRDLRCPALKEPVSFALRRGEILGFAGLVGSGRSELWRAIFGADPRAGGTILVNGQEREIRSPADAIAAGLALVPEDRKDQGLILEFAVRENISLAGLRRHAAAGIVNRARENADTGQYVQALDIRTPSWEQKARNLSGGNQQKVVLAKWLSLNPRVLILDEPTRGIDVGAKAFIHARIAELASQGMAIALISSELEEIIAMSDRVIVLSEGRVAGELSRPQISEESIMALASGAEVAA
jgi:ABC-type sugar transport system ATPase subunit